MLQEITDCGIPPSFWQGRHSRAALRREAGASLPEASPVGVIRHQSGIGGAPFLRLSGGSAGSATPSSERFESASGAAVPFSTKTSTVRAFEPVDVRHCGENRTSPVDVAPRSEGNVAQPARRRHKNIVAGFVFNESGHSLVYESSEQA